MMRTPPPNARPGAPPGRWRNFWGAAVLRRFGFHFPPAPSAILSRLALCAATILLLPLAAAADNLLVTNETPVFVLDIRLPSTDPGLGSLIVQFETPSFTLDTRLPAGDPGPSSLIVQFESPPFVLDTRLPSDITTIPNLVTQSESPPFALDTRLPSDTTPFPNLITQIESPPFTLDTRLPSDATPLPNLIVQFESPPFTLDTRIPPQDPLYTNLIALAESGPFNLDTLSGWFKTPAQNLTGGSTSGKARFAPDGLRLAKTDGSQVLLWNLQSIRSNTVFAGHRGQVASLDFSPLGDQLLTGSADGTFRWWDAASRIELGRSYPPGGGTVYAAYASDGARVLAGRGGNVALYRASTMELLRELPGSEGTVTAVALAPEGLALAGNSARSVAVWDTATGTLLYRLTNHTGLITAAAFYPGGSNAMTASLDGTIRVWDMATGVETLCIQAGTQMADAVLSYDGSVIASCDGGNPGTAYLWDAQSGALMRVFTDTSWDASQINAVALSPDQTALATTHVDGRVRLWNTGLEPLPIYPVTPLPIGTNAPVTLRSHGLYYFAVEAEAGRSLVVTLEADPGGAVGAKAVKSLGGSADIPVRSGPGLSTDAEFANLGSPEADKNVGAPGPKSLQTPPPSADITAFRMTAAKGKLPSEYDYESFAQATVSNLHCELPMAFASSSKGYVLVFAPYLAAGSITARIRAEYSDFHLSSVSPNRGGNAGTVTAEIQGTGFVPEMAVRLKSGKATNALGRIVWLIGPTRMFVTFDMHDVMPGHYAIEIQKQGSAPLSLDNAFEVTAGTGPLLQARLTAPSAVRIGRTYSLTLDYGNVGDADMAAPLLMVSSPQNVLMALPSASAMQVTPSVFEAGPMQVLAINFQGPAGVLPPGAHFTIPVFFQAINVRQIDFVLAAMKTDSTPADWASVAAQMKPPSMDPSAWRQTFAKFQEHAGTNWSTYLQMLGDTATRQAFYDRYEYAVRNLLGIHLPQSYGLPINTISGTVSRADTGQVLAAVEIAAWNTNSAMTRWTMTDWAGAFTFDNLVAGQYQLSVSGYYLLDGSLQDLSGNTDATGLCLNALPVDEGNGPTPPPLPEPDSAPSLITGKDGQLDLVWKHGNQIWHAANSGSGWSGASQVANAEGLAPKAAYGPNLFNGNSPGLIVVWQSGDGNQSKLYSSTGQASEAGPVWNAVRALTSDNYGDTLPAVTVLQSGLPIILWLQRDFSIEDDDDLYYMVQANTPGVLWQEANRIGSSGRMSAAKADIGRCWSAGFGSAKATIPIIGRSFGFDGSGEVCFELSGCSYGGSGEVAVSTELGDTADLAVKCAAEARMVVRPKSLMYSECETVFDYLKIGPRIEGTFHFPYPPLTFQVPYLSVEAGLRVVLSGGGDMVWRGENFGGWPPNEATVEVGLGGGPYGKVKWWSRHFEIYGEISGTITYTVPPGRWEFDGIKVRACWEGNAHSIREKGGCWQLGPFFGPAKSALRISAGQSAPKTEIRELSPQSRIMTLQTQAKDSPGTYTETETVHELIGTGRVYEGAPVLADITNDIKDDGRPSVATSTLGETLVAWTKDSANPQAAVGSALMVAAFTGAAWTPPVEVDGTTDFNNDPAIAFDSGGTPMIVWANAPANVTLASSLAEMDAAMNATDIMYSQRLNGTWTPPQKVVALPGKDSDTVLAAGPARQCVAAWIHQTETGSDIYAAVWDGATWTSVTKLSQVSINKDPTVGFLGNFPVVIWAQDADGDPNTENDLSLYQSVFNGTWSAPVPALSQVQSPVSARAFAKAMPKDAGNFGGLLPPPEGCCGEDPPPPRPPDPPPEPLGTNTAPVVRPVDPNEKFGPTGTGPNQVVSTNDFMEYLVRFENIATATAPVQELIVVDYLDANLDWTTVEFEEIAYGDRLLTAPAHAQSFAFRDVPPTNSPSLAGSGVTNLAVNVSGMFNPQAGRTEWRVAVLDTNTGFWPMDALSGILPPEDGSGRGQGHVKLRVKPKVSVPLGTFITNTATIVFDNNDPITTAPVWNMIGDVPSLAATIAYLPGRITAGMPFFYTVAVTNTGTNLVGHVVLTNALPSGVTVLNATATQGTVTVTDGTIIWDLGTVTNGVGAFLTVAALPSQEGTFANTIYYSGGSGLAIFTSPSQIVVLPGGPRLGIRMTDGKLVLSWSTNYSGFHLQSSASVSSGACNDLTNAPVIIGQEYQVTLDQPSAPTFFRLANGPGESSTPPKLRINVASGQVSLYWPTSSTGFQLQRTTALGPTPAWATVTNAPATVGSEFRLQLGSSGTAEFYRLAKP